MSSLGDSQLRELVREALAELVPQLMQGAVPAALAPRPVTLRNDADLARFVVDLCEIAAKPGGLAKLLNGQIGFTLAQPEPEPKKANGQHVSDPILATVQEARPTPVLRIEKGAVTERIVAQAASSGSNIVLGSRAVATPLAKEAARRSGITIERAP
jgi:hypothetical protein